MTARLHRGLEVVAPAGMEDVVARLAWEVASSGVEVRDAGGGGARFRVYLPEGPPASSARRFGELWRRYAGEAAGDPIPFAEPERDWSGEARRGFGGTEVGPFWIGPPWVPAPEGRRAVLVNPGRAFGTGLHPTTRLALRLLPRALPRGVRVMDLGTGSGVLALACLSLGAERVTALDVDPHAVANARENAHLNAAEGRVGYVVGTLTALGPAARFDLALANLERPLLEPLLPDLARSLAGGGRLVASGTLARERGELLRAARDAGLEALAELEEEEWWGASLAAS